MENAVPPLLLDQGLPRDAAQQLRVSDVRCTHVGELGMSAAADIEILEWARLHGSAVVTLDADFHAILAVRGATKTSVIRLRMQGLNGTAVARLLLQILAEYRAELGVGCMITVKPRKTTCHLLSRID